MTDKRTVTIGVNINLGNYENLRVEVSDIAEDESAVRDLTKFLGDALDGFGTNNATTKAAIDKYKERVLDEYAPEKEQEPAYEPVIIPSFEQDDDDEHIDEPDILLPEYDDEPEIQESVFAPPPKPEIKTEVPKPASTPVLAPAPDGEFICEKCGAAVSKVQRDVSNLFMGKTLCKNCMK